MKKIHSSRYLKSRRIELRNNATSHESKLWKVLKKSQLGYKFQRQHSIGPYIVDFYCAKKRLIIELDGEVHKNNKEYDVERMYFLSHLNFNILRFWNEEIDSHMDIVIERIQKILKIEDR